MPNSYLPPGSWLGLLGGGQLGRLFCMAAQRMAYRVAVLDLHPDSPAAQIADKTIIADYSDQTALAQLADLCSAVTTEFENVPAASLEFLAQRVAVHPCARCVAIAQDRISEKRFVQACGVKVVPYAVIQRAEDLHLVADELFPGILKASRLGYDGKGQIAVTQRAQAQAAFAQLGSVACVLEKLVALDHEIAVLLVRDAQGKTAAYPVVENHHHHGILAVTTVPARHTAHSTQTTAIAIAHTLANHMDYVGVLCVEFFVLKNGDLLVNEMAPRPHNSGHYTIDACVTSQFEQQVRVLAGLPLGSAHQHSPAVMLNLLGDLWFSQSSQPQQPDWLKVLNHSAAKLHLYSKHQARVGRKMGHITLLAHSDHAVDMAALNLATRAICDAFALPH